MTDSVLISNKNYKHKKEELSERYNQISPTRLGTKSSNAEIYLVIDGVCIGHYPSFESIWDVVEVKVEDSEKAFCLTIGEVPASKKTPKPKLGKRKSSDK